MRVAIISDIHDNLVNLEKCLSWCEKEKIAQLICCGDVTNAETLGVISELFGGVVHLVRGNLEIYKEEEIKKYDNIKYYGRYGRFEIDGKKIGICHEPWFVDDILRLEKCDIVFYGHTHEPWIEEQDGVKTINPGTLGAVFQKATFAVWDTTKSEPELKILELL